jgi:seryl-tRNA synthetase
MRKRRKQAEHASRNAPSPRPDWRRARGPDDLPVAPARAAPPRNHRAAPAGRFADPTPELARRGELLVTGDGRVAFSGQTAALCQWFDERFARMAAGAGAVSHQFPALIGRETLARAGYFEAFGETATRVAARGAEDSHVLSPAVCYHCYARFAGQRLAQPLLITCAGKCFRREPEGFDSLLRLWEFTMREVVFLGPGDWVAQQRREWRERVWTFTQSLGLLGEIAPATDSFMGGQARGKKLLQQVKELKYELRLELGGGKSAAVASFNLHETHFTERFGLTLADGTAACSGCVAFGLERWVLAFLTQRGLVAPGER